MRFNIAVPLLVLLSACGGDDGGGGGGSADAATAPAMITISGKATKREGTASSDAAGVVVAAYKNSDPNTVVVMGTTDATGMYSLMIPTGGTAVDGFLKATLSGFLDVYLYPPKPLSADYDGASLNILNQSTLDLLSGTLCGSAQEATKGVIAVLVVDATDTAVAGATVTATPAAAKTCYNQGGLPNRNATMTDADGIAYFLNVPAGEVTVTATKAGTTYRNQKVNARAGAFTTTPIQP
jgi:hypothetical protein